MLLMRNWLAAALLTLAIAPGAPAFAQDTEPPAQELHNSEFLDIELGRSIVVEEYARGGEVSLTDESVADVKILTAPNGILRVQILGKALGSTDIVLNIDGRDEPIVRKITVHRDITDLVRRVRDIVPENTPRIYPMEGRLVVQGAVDDLDTLEQVALVTRIYDPDFVNLLTVRGDHQVQLKVVFAEVSRTAIRQLGLNILYNGSNLSGGIVQGARGSILPTQNYQLPLAEGPFQIFAIAKGANIAAMLSIMDQYNLSKVLAQPTLVALSGQEADFLAGAEVPVPVPGQNGTVTIDFHEFGTKLSFVPTVLRDDVIDVRVDMEFSERDESLAVSVAGVSVPGFTSRKAKSHVRIKNTETFAIAGLLSERTTMVRSQVPGLGDIPVIGALFRTVAHQKVETELMIFVTPELVRPMAPGEVPPPPGTTENNNPTDLELFLLGKDTRGNSKIAAPSGAVGIER